MLTSFFLGERASLGSKDTLQMAKIRKAVKRAINLEHQKEKERKRFKVNYQKLQYML